MTDNNRLWFQEMEQATGITLNPVQQEAVLHTGGPLLLLATPGAGKTDRS